MSDYDPKLWARTAQKYMPTGTSRIQIECDASLIEQALRNVRDKYGWPLSLVIGRFQPDPPRPGRRAVKGRHIYERADIDAFNASVDAGINQFFVRDESRHPHLPAADDDDPYGWLAVNGLPRILTPLPDRTAYTVDLIGAIYHTQTLEKVDHLADAELFKKLRLEVKRLIRERDRKVKEKRP